MAQTHEATELHATAGRARNISLKETAVMVRAALKAAFPKCKFSVRGEHYRMGCHIDVYWTDGPTRDQVAQVTDFYHGTSFDAMGDSTGYHDRTLPSGERVHFAGSCISGHRRVSDALRQRCAEIWTNADLPTRAAMLNGDLGRYRSFNERAEEVINALCWVTPA